MMGQKRLKSDGQGAKTRRGHFAKAPRLLKGFTLTEFVVVTVVLVLIATVFFNRAKVYQERAEKTAMTEVVAAIQNQLLMDYAHMRAEGGGTEGIVALTSENPMASMARPPDNYAGEFDSPSSATVAPGSWMFDLKSRELIYVPERTDNFVPDADGEMWIRYRIRLKYDAASSVSGEKLPRGVLFEPTEPYNWFGQAQ